MPSVTPIQTSHLIPQTKRARTCFAPHSPATPRTADVSHLSYRQKTNLGSFYTPRHLVQRAHEMLSRHIPANYADTILDPACGYGAFFAHTLPNANVRRIGVDIDCEALDVARQQFPEIDFFHTNALVEISRAKYGITDRERLVIVGNPPYNDVTSHVKNGLKATPCEIDSCVRTRDLGLSFLIAMAKLSPDYIAVLHPLSYLIKEANFRILRPLLQNYNLRDALVFSSQEFTETSKGCGFPIVLALYARDALGTSYEQIRNRRFSALEGTTFSLVDYDYVCRYATKYPTRFSASNSSSPHFRFFTMRDINALKRSRTFIQEDTANTIYIHPEKLEYYCYVDAFKDIAGTLPYYFGNLDVLIDKPAFELIREDFLILSIAKHPTVFSPKYSQPDMERLSLARSRVNEYFQKLFQNLKICL